jgi:hypothetical protein
LSLVSCLFVPSISARTTPADILNEQKQVYENRVKNYSPASKQKLTDLSQKIAALNKQATSDWETNMIRQGEILDEYMHRNNLQEGPETDGIHRNLSNDVENARYWLTFAHEAVAYQAARVYIFDLTSETNINSDINRDVTQLSSDLNILRGKVLKSQKLIEALVTNQ